MRKVAQTLRSLAGGRYFWPISILGFSLALRLFHVFMFQVKIVPGEDPVYYLRIAHNLFDGVGYREFNLFAYRPPLYAYFMAAVFSVFGNTMQAVRIVQAFLGAFMCLGIYLMGKTMLSVRAGVIAAIICAIYPQLIYYSGQIWSEQLFMFLLTFAALFYLLSEQRSSALWGIAAGIFAGLCALTREVGFLILVGFLLWALITSRYPLKATLRWGLVALFALLTVAPWTVRNYLVFHRFVLVANNGGVNFYIGNNPQADGTFKWTLPPGATWNQPSPKAFFETEASSLGYKYGIQFIKDNPGRFIALILKRAGQLFKTSYEAIDLHESKAEIISRTALLLMYVVLIFFTVFVAPFFLRSNFRPLSFFYIVIFMLVLPHLLTFGNPRFRLPTIPFMALIVAVVAHRITDHKKAREIFR